MRAAVSNSPEKSLGPKLLGTTLQPSRFTDSRGTLSPRGPAGAGRPPLDEYFNALFTAFGPQHWWPGKSKFEVILGAILTQNTTWKSAERAISNLRSAELMTPAAIEQVSIRRLEKLIRPS